MKERISPESWTRTGFEMSGQDYKGKFLSVGPYVLGRYERIACICSSIQAPSLDDGQNEDEQQVRCSVF